MASLGAILLVSIKAIASLFIQVAIGATVAWFGVIRESDMRALSALMNAVLVPLLSAVSLGRGLSLKMFASDGWILASLGLFSVMEFGALGFLFLPLAKPEPQFRRLFGTPLPALTPSQLRFADCACGS